MARPKILPVVASCCVLRWTRACAIPLVVACNAVDPPAPILGFEEGIEARPSGQIVDAGTSSCVLVTVSSDLDGDGIAGTQTAETESFQTCADHIPLGFSATLGDCDDTDPFVSREACVDRDGDGALHSGYVCVGKDSSAGEVSCLTGEPHDCDDSDPEKIDVVYLDGDGDGIGALPGTCGKFGDGWSMRAGDCNDTDPEIPFRAWEIVGDDIDSDCDGNDHGACEAPWDRVDWAEGFVLRAGDCGTTDLVIGTTSCSTCAEQMATVAVENRGDSEIAGSLFITTHGSEDQGSSPIELTIPIELAPGEQRLLFSGPMQGTVIAMLESPLESTGAEYVGDAGTMGGEDGGSRDDGDECDTAAGVAYVENPDCR